MTKDERTGKYEAHVMEVATLAKRVGEALDLKADALQSCFATLMIDTSKYGIFFEPPTPRSSVTPVAPPTPKEENFQTGPEGLAAAKAEVADEIPKNVTIEQSDDAVRTELLKGVNNARNLLNRAGHTPPVTPKGVNKLIETKMGIKGTPETLDNEQLSQLLKIMTDRLDELKKPEASGTSDDDFNA